MIDLIKFTPAVYSRQSRDYQVLCRLYTILYNNVKMYIDSMDIWNSKLDNKLISLKSRTINFIPKHTWDLEELKTVVSCFKYLCRHKGTTETLYYCINILMRVQGIKYQLVDGAITYDNGDITIRMDSDIVSIGIVEDLIEYLIPAGCTYRILKYSEINPSGSQVTEVFYGEDTVESSKETYDPEKMKVSEDDEFATGETKTVDFTDTVIWEPNLNTTKAKVNKQTATRKRKVKQNVNKK